MFIPLFDHKAPAEAKAYAATLADARFGILDEHLTGREFLLDTFSIADAYLCTVLNWTRAVPIDLAKWPAIKALSQPHAQAAEHRARLGRGARALYGGAGAAQGGVTPLMSSRPRASGAETRAAPTCGCIGARPRDALGGSRDDSYPDRS